MYNTCGLSFEINDKTRFNFFLFQVNPKTRGGEGDMWSSKYLDAKEELLGA
jgi:hypothetical protein